MTTAREWNFAVLNSNDQATIAPEFARGIIGGMWSAGPEYVVLGGNQPYSTAMTMLFSFFYRRHWSARQRLGAESIYSIGYNGCPNGDALYIYTAGSPRYLGIEVIDTVSGITRYHIILGDENGTDWILTNKWYQCGVSFDSTGVTYCVNNSNTPTRNILTNSPGAITLSDGNERLWFHGAHAGKTGRTFEENLTHGGDCPSAMFGSAALHNAKIDLTDSTVKNRIWTPDGQFKNPGEDYSLWFGDTYGGTVPSQALLDGSPRCKSGSADPVISSFENGMSSTTPGWSAGNAMGSAPGGLKKQYYGDTIEYEPGMMRCYSVSSKLEKAGITTSGNKVAAIVQLGNLAAKTGGTYGCVFHVLGSGGHDRLQIRHIAADHATVGNRNKIQVFSRNSAGTIVCWLQSKEAYTIPEEPVIAYSYDADTGNATFTINGVDADDGTWGGRIAPTVQTLDAGSSTFRWGTDTAARYEADFGFFGYDDQYISDWSGFMTTEGPIKINESTWAEWNTTQPIWWNQFGQVDDNKGTAGNASNLQINGPN